MLVNEVPDSAPEPENNETTFRPLVVGRILSERFLIEEDLSDPALRGLYTSHRVKDLKRFCRDVWLNIVNVSPAIEAGPSLKEVCDLLTEVSHRNIETVLESGTLFDGRPYSISERFDGERLESVVRNGRRLELEHAARIIEQIADGLSIVHKKGILHCDLRPWNVIVSDEGRSLDSLKITNFGTAWPIDVRGHGFDHLPRESECFAYAAPETYARLGHRSTAADVYSLAVIAYRLLTGKMPFDWSDPRERLEKISRNEWVPATELRTDLGFESENILNAGLQFEPAWRPQDIEDFAYRLVSSLRPAPIVSTIRVVPAMPPKADEWVTVIEEEKPLPAPIELVEEQPQIKAQRRIPSIISDRAVAWALISLLLAGALSIPIAQTLLNEEKAEAAVGTMQDRTPENRSKRQLKFWIESKAAGEPVFIAEAARSSIANALIALVPDSAGEIYVIGESNDAEGRVGYKLLSQQASSGPVAAAKAVRTPLLDLTKERAVWIVWTATPSQDFESNLQAATADSPIAEAARNLRHFLERNRNLRLEASSGGSGAETLLTGIGDRMVYRISIPAN